MNKLQIYLVSLSLLSGACGNSNNEFDASGTFEAEEVIVASEIGGQLITFDVREGQTLTKGQLVGTIDAESLDLQKQQVEASINALHDKTADVNPQIRLLESQVSVQQAELDKQLREKVRTANLIKADAATQKQLDDINSQIEILRRQIGVTKQQIRVQKNNVQTQNRSILSEEKPLKKKVEQLEDQLNKASIINPTEGTVLTKYAEAGEITNPGKALYKIADLNTIILRAYITGAQLSEVKLNQAVMVRVDKGEDDYKQFTGTITYISDKAEFTPKTIQTKDERANLVYAVKIKVKNDGYLKIGMYGEVLLNAPK
ncbi:MAG TPA: HlyD family efflux transporter periplasmic adaptor subunit [Sphingobacteriaceae bacterium]